MVRVGGGLCDDVRCSYVLDDLGLVGVRGGAALEKSVVSRDWKWMLEYVAYRLIFTLHLLLLLGALRLCDLALSPRAFRGDEGQLLSSGKRVGRAVVPVHIVNLCLD